MTRVLLPICTFVAILGLSISIAAAGDLKQIRDAQKLAAEKLTAQVDSAVERSRKLDPADARFTLMDMLRKVKDSPDLLEKERSQLVTRLQLRLTIVEDALRAKRVAQDTTPPAREPPPRYTPPVKDPSKGVSGGAKSFIDSAKSAATTNSQYVREREKGVGGLLKDPAPLPINTETGTAFPANWVALSQRRKEFVSQKLTEKETKLLKALNSTMKFDYENEKFKAVIEHIMERTGLTIIMDPASLQDANVDYEGDTVSLKFPKLGVRTGLKKILGDKGLTYIIKEGSIQVMTPKRASEYTVVRTYQIDDLIQPDAQMQMMFGPFVAQLQMMQNAQQLINLIQFTVEPSYWQPNGPGSIGFYYPTRSLIIRASTEMHYQLGSPGLFGGR